MKNHKQFCRRGDVRLSIKRHRRNGGFSLLESCVALLLMSLLLLATIELFIDALRNDVDSKALVFANLDAANTLQSIVESTREAYYFNLPDEANFTTPSGAMAGNYETTTDVNGNAETICTGMDVTFPNAVQVVSLQYDDGSVHNTPGFYSRDASINSLTPGTEIMYYRSDPNGTPDANAGACLWAYSLSDNGQTINRSLINTIATGLPNAIQFVRPQTVPNALGVTTSIPYEVEIKVICAYYAPTGGGASNETGNGEGTTALTGKCVFMRDHEASDNNESGSTNPINNQYTP
jgi:type II secretory pathway pseudopilin PulG